jgi:hypothetical protein
MMAKSIISRKSIEQLRGAVSAMAYGKCSEIPGARYLADTKLIDYLSFDSLPSMLKLFHVIFSTHLHINITFIGNSLKQPGFYQTSLKRVSSVEAGPIERQAFLSNA